LVPRVHSWLQGVGPRERERKARRGMEGEWGKEGGREVERNEERYGRWGRERVREVEE